MLQQVDLQHTVVHCNTLQHPATPCNILEHTCNMHTIHVHHTRICCCKSPCKTLQHMQQTAANCNTLQHTATHWNTHGSHMHVLLQVGLQRNARHCNALQRTATHCNAMQHTATHCKTLQYTCSTHASHTHHTCTCCIKSTCNTLQHTATQHNTHTTRHTCNTHASHSHTLLQVVCAEQLGGAKFKAFMYAKFKGFNESMYSYTQQVGVQFFSRAAGWR